MESLLILTLSFANCKFKTAAEDNLSYESAGGNAYKLC